MFLKWKIIRKLRESHFNNVGNKKNSIMNYISVQLHEMIEEIGEEKTKSILADFSCAHNEDIVHFLNEKAIEFENHRRSRTTLIYAQEDEGNVKLVAFYSLPISKMECSSDMSRRERKKYFGTTYALGKSISSILIG